MVTTTEKHPIYVVGKGWTWAGELKSGDMILGHDGQSTAVESISSTNRHESLYNLRVAFDRTYFVGSRQWGFSLWAHNAYSIESVVRNGEEVFQVINTETKEVKGEFASLGAAQIS